MLVALADASFFDSFNEAGALAGHLNEARHKSSSQPVRELAPTPSRPFGFSSSPLEVETGGFEPGFERGL
jgi:hypothetical protein